jgi:hypothetical protein
LKVIKARALLLADGSSDGPLGTHAAAIARLHGVALDVVAPEFGRMDKPPGRAVKQRLERMLRIDRDFDVLLVHRDCENDTVANRENEIFSGVHDCGVDWSVVPIVPIRMTEAWLLLDEDAIRVVAGRPSGGESLDLPRLSQIESMPDPKARLQAALEVACGLSGRHLRKFKRDFPAHRRQLLERLDRAGGVRQLKAWQALEKDTASAMVHLIERRNASG